MKITSSSIILMMLCISYVTALPSFAQGFINRVLQTTGCSAQPTDDSRCATWATNGFCTSSFYSLTQKQQFCPITCRLCNTTSPSTTTPTQPTADCKDSNENCANWKLNGYCTSEFYTQENKIQNCKFTCNLCNSVPTCKDNNTNCKLWNSNGFCTSAYYTLETKVQYCPFTCNLCHKVISTTSP